MRRSTAALTKILRPRVHPKERAMAKLGRCRVQYSHSGVERGQHTNLNLIQDRGPFLEEWGTLLAESIAESVEGRVRLSLFLVQAQLPAPAVHYIQEDHVRVPEEGRDLTRWRSCSLSRIDRWTRSVLNTHSQNIWRFQWGYPHWSCIYRWDVPWISYYLVRLGHYFMEHPQYVDRTVREDESSNLVDASRHLKFPRMWRLLEGLHEL
jgi:hypothetical protein